MGDAWSLGEIVTPILERIGFDFTRIRELDTGDVVTVCEAHSRANALMLETLVGQVGDEEAAGRILDFTRRMPQAKQTERRHRFAELIERGERPPPRYLAAHLAYSLDIASALTVEIERRVTGASLN